jgi:preprotein translocase subunit YajC
LLNYQIFQLPDPPPSGAFQIETLIQLHPISSLLAQSSGSAIFGLLPLIAIFAIFYLMLILPQQKRQKKWQAMVAALKNGDKVVTSGGIRGTVISLKDDAVQLRVPPDNLRIEVARSAVTALVNPEEAK